MIEGIEGRKGCAEKGIGEFWGCPEELFRDL